MDLKNKNNQLAVILMGIAALLFVLGLFILPDTLVMQLTAGGGSPTTMPKPLGLAIPLALTVLFSVLAIKRPDQPKNLLVALVGVLVGVLTFVMNL